MSPDERNHCNVATANRSSLNLVLVHDILCALTVHDAFDGETTKPLVE